tara:strand:- start:6551 stop:7519 length:969 start_codon:yes stop_codon:yes gene_type:complete
MNIDVKNLLNQFKEKHILVIGDVMLDKYIWGSVDRISPEAPVPVVNVNKSNHHPGGAANVARNIYGLGGNVTLIGVIGDDRSGELLQSILADDSGINCQLITDKDRETTIKTRIIAHGQQVVRLDRENSSPLSDITFEKLQATISHQIDQVDGIILQDYNKGIFNKQMITWIMELCKDRSVPVFVDPKKSNFTSYSGARLFKPNFLEFLSNLNGLTDLNLSGEEFRSKNGYEMLIVTQGEKGMTLFTEKGQFKIETKARDVHDVSGAGDTVIATFTLCDICGYSPDKSALMANLAAGRVCEEAGVVPIDANSLLDIVKHHHD